MELLDLVDENGVPTGEVKERELVHRDGDRHRTSHVWLFRQRNGRWQVLLQKRSEQKDSHPGCYDISSAGHIPAGVDWVSSALRELEEELGKQLFVRSNRKITLTEEGMILRKRAAEILELVKLSLIHI